MHFCVSADTKTCGSPLSATSVAIVIIPNLVGMFNENRAFFVKKFTLEIAENAENMENTERKSV